MASGLTLGQLSGVWITGAPSPGAPAGLTLGQLSGIWVTGSPGLVVPESAGLTLGQLSGIWVTGASELVVPVSEGGAYDHDNVAVKQLRRMYEQNLVAVICTVVEVINGQHS